MTSAAAERVGSGRLNAASRRLNSIVCPPSVRAASAPASTAARRLALTYDRLPAIAMGPPRLSFLVFLTVAPFFVSVGLHLSGAKPIARAVALLRAGFASLWPQSWAWVGGEGQAARAATAASTSGAGDAATKLAVADVDKNRALFTRVACGAVLACVWCAYGGGLGGGTATAFVLHPLLAHSMVTSEWLRDQILIRHVISIYRFMLHPLLAHSMVTAEWLSDQILT